MAGRVIRRGAKWGGITGELLDQADLHGVLTDTFGLAYAWSPTKTYVRGEPCIYNGFMFQSLSGGNTGNSPIANPTWWTYFCPPVEGVPASEGAVFVAGSTVHNVGVWEPRSQFMIGMVGEFDAARQYTAGEFVAYNGALWLCSGDPPDVGYTPPGDGSFNNEYWWKPQMFSPSAGLSGQVIVKHGNGWSQYDWQDLLWTQLGGDPRDHDDVRRHLLTEYSATHQYVVGDVVWHVDRFWHCSATPPGIGYPPPVGGSVSNTYWNCPSLYTTAVGSSGQVLKKFGPLLGNYTWDAQDVAYTPDAAFTLSGGQITAYNAAIGGVHVRVPPSIGGVTITSTAQDVFASKSLISLELPDTISSIGQGLAFSNPDMRHLRLPNNSSLTSLPAYVSSSSNLTMVEVPESVTSIHTSAFNAVTAVVGTPGSFAHRWCKTNNRTFISNGKPPIAPCVMWTAENDLFSANHLHPFYPFLLNGGTWQITGAANANHPGVAACVSHATNINSGAILTLDSATCIQLNGGEELICCFKFHTLNADIKYVIGFGDSRTVATCVDGVLLEGTGTTANFRAYNNSVVTEGGSFTLSQDTWYRLTIRLSDDGTVATCALYNPANSLTISYSLSTGLPTGTGRTLTVLFGSWKTTATLAWMLAVDYVRVSCRRFLDR